MYHASDDLDSRTPLSRDIRTLNAALAQIPSPRLEIQIRERGDEDQYRGPTHELGKHQSGI